MLPSERESVQFCLSDPYRSPLQQIHTLSLHYQTYGHIDTEEEYRGYYIIPLAVSVGRSRCCCISLYIQLAIVTG